MRFLPYAGSKQMEDAFCLIEPNWNEANGRCTDANPHKKHACSCSKSVPVLSRGDYTHK